MIDQPLSKYCLTFSPVNPSKPRGGIDTPQSPFTFAVRYLREEGLDARAVPMRFEGEPMEIDPGLGEEGESAEDQAWAPESTNLPGA